jgi:hypothetical protein
MRLAINLRSLGLGNLRSLCSGNFHWLVLASLLFVLGCTSKPDGSSTASTTAADRELPSDTALRDRLDQVLDFTLNKRHLNTKDHAAWQIVHGILVYGRDFQIYADGKLVPALDYLLKGGELSGWHLYHTDHGIATKVEPGTKTGQGHEDQWLGYLSQCGITPDEQLMVNGEAYTVNDLITHAQWHMNDGLEATWSLMAFSKYLPLDAKWPAKDGTEWTIPRIVELELSKNLAESACGGTHRMYGLTTALNRFKAENEHAELTGPWLATDEKIKSCIAKARKFQQPDGSLSTNFFERPATSAEIATRIHSTGHTLEFIVLASPDRDLSEPWITRAALHLVDLLEETQELPLECGALYHAVHGLQLYRNRRFGQRDPAGAASPAEPPSEAMVRPVGDGEVQR